MNDKPSILNLPQNHYIAYYKVDGKENKPSVMFLGGFMSDMTGTKATALEEFCREKGYGFVRFDYFGHGQSSGKFVDGNISVWKENAITALDKLTKGKQILVGSSMGGWLMLLAALARPERVAALIGIASAPDFTEDLIWDVMEEDAKEQLRKTGVYHFKSDYGDDPYPITMQLIEDGRKHLLLKDNIRIHCPVRLIHGMKDEDVPSSCSVMLAQQLTSSDVKVKLVENGDHRMSTPENIELLCNTLEGVAEKLSAV